MECQVAHLIKFIEEMRRELIQLGKSKPLTDPEVVKLSQRLDRLLNEYQLISDKVLTSK
ncbi:aspartyl-phosphate phosphatase Spo0E family protein [Desulfitobacterium sp.]|uniref:aspartyl-phosphate phosphatase Spo0E family protein n=1 Tax=Desulfitobacterium sp. TaxID=49981 RepID=UPI002BF014C9|nr:aspartyl-phosphate phosphatase Spo0E family protein [Desulfitobacterium sp.]HVJ47649.1 aspartyl-phosphate phosphatase Spo0E family protein [Desulfitobacterium sp.]